jgi:hypothetical protein
MKQTKYFGLLVTVLPFISMDNQEFTVLLIPSPKAHRISHGRKTFLPLLHVFQV